MQEIFFNNLNIQKNVFLAPLTTFGIGGKARFFVLVKTPEEIIAALDWAKKQKIPYKIFAGGSNVVISDKDFNCLVIKIFGGKIAIKNTQITAGAGALLSSLVKKSTTKGLAGLEALMGIPGTVGGAIVGNAGAYDHSISEVIDKIEIWDGKKRRWLSKKKCQFDYRESLFKKKKWLILKAVFSFSKDDPQRLKKIVQEILKKRKTKYRPGLKTPGCFFKNPLVKNVGPRTLGLIDKKKIIEGKIPAGYLLEKIGAKGMKMGNIEVAQFHANFLINKGQGTARDVKKLARILKRKVEQKFGIELEEEVRYL